MAQPSQKVTESQESDNWPTLDPSQVGLSIGVVTESQKGDNLPTLDPAMVGLSIGVVEQHITNKMSPGVHEFEVMDSPPGTRLIKYRPLGAQTWKIADLSGSSDSDSENEAELQVEPACPEFYALLFSDSEE